MAWKRPINVEVVFCPQTFVLKSSFIEICPMSEIDSYFNNSSFVMETCQFYVIGDRSFGKIMDRSSLTQWSCKLALI